MKKSKSVIKLITHPYPVEIMQARQDHANITGQPLMEKAWWYEDMENGYLYHDIYGCLAWPSEVTEKGAGLPGYVAIVGVIRPKNLDKDTHYDPRDAKFLLLAEAEHKSVPILLEKCVEMREKYGYGVQTDLLTVWFGDQDRFYRPLALFNERLGEQKEILITPPDDFYTPKIFDNYVRSFESCIVEEDDKYRFYYNHHDILKTRLNEFYKDDPAVLAIGGLVHSLLGRCMWMGQSEQGAGCFTVEEG